MSSSCGPNAHRLASAIACDHSLSSFSRPYAKQVSLNVAHSLLLTVISSSKPLTPLTTFSSILRFFDPGNVGGACSTEGSCVIVVIFVALSTLGKERPWELEDGWYPGLMAFICYFDKMKLWFTRALTEEQSFFVVIRDFCFELRVSLSQNRRLIAELEALGKWGDALTALEALREIVARDVVKLGVLEQLVACTRVGIPLKAGYIADMEDKEYSFLFLVFWIRFQEYVFVMMF
ncbi:hypothetical protein Tco_0415035 [Tanacetum coccineum]